MFAATPPQAAGQPVPPRDQRPAAQTGTAVIRGCVVAGDTGQPLRRARITLSAPELERDGRSATTNMDGRYEIKDLPANSSDRAGEEPPEGAVVPIAVDGVDITNVNLTGSMGGSVSGRVQEPLIGQTSPAMLGAFTNPGFGLVNEDGTFTLKNVFGPARFDVTVPDGWAVKGILHDGRDITDVPIELKSGDELTGVQVILTDYLTSVTGLLTDDKGAPLRDGTVVVFSTDPARWLTPRGSSRPPASISKGNFRSFAEDHP